jgi:hypothetical protein
MTEYLAYVLIGGGSAWGRSEGKEAAIDLAIKSLKDWNTYYDVSDKEVTVRVVEITGYDEVVWEDNEISGKKPGSFLLPRYGCGAKYGASVSSIRQAGSSSGTSACNWRAF